MDNNILNSLNKDGKNLQVNVQVITLDDNLSHTYFSLLDIAIDNSHPLGVAIMEMPYDLQIANYWIKYYGTVIASFNISDYQTQNTNSEEFLKKFGLKNKIINPHYNYSLICKVSRFKQKGKKFIVYFENLGWKFLQKVPNEFRQTYVANQSLDDVFQAMCEFLNVQFACSIKDLHEYNFGANGYSIEKGGETIESTETVLSKWGQTKDEPKKDAEETEEDTPTSTTIEKNTDDKSIASDATNNTEDINNVNVQPTDDIQEKIDKNQEDFENKILDLFRGNTYYESNLTDPIMNYENITITPKAPTTSNENMSTIDNSNTSESNTNNENNTTDSNTTAQNEVLNE